MDISKAQFKNIPAYQLLIISIIHRHNIRMLFIIHCKRLRVLNPATGPAACPGKSTTNFINYAILDIGIYLSIS